MALLRQLVTRHRGWVLVVALVFTLGIVVGSVQMARAGWMGQGLAAGLGNGGTAQSAHTSAPPSKMQVQWSNTMPTRTAQEIATEQAGVNAQGQRGAPVGPIATIPPGSGPSGAPVQPPSHRQ